jgi:hypothetical protein
MKCEFKPYLEHHPTVQALTTTTWAISAEKEAIIQSSCVDLNNPNKPLQAWKDLRFKGDYLLHVPRHCSAIIAERVIPLRLHLHTTMPEENLLHLTAPDTDTVLEQFGNSLKDSRVEEGLITAFKALDEIRTENDTRKQTEKVTQLLQQLMKATASIEEQKGVFPTSDPERILNRILWIMIVLVGLYCAWKWRRTIMKYLPCCNATPVGPPPQEAARLATAPDHHSSPPEYSPPWFTGKRTGREPPRSRSYDAKYRPSSTEPLELNIG